MSFNFNNRSGVIGPDGVQNSTADATAKKVEWVRGLGGRQRHWWQTQDNRQLDAEYGINLVGRSLTSGAVERD